MVRKMKRSRSQQKAIWANSKGRTLPMISVIDIKTKKLYLAKGKRLMTKKEAFSRVPTDGIFELRKRKYGSLSLGIAFTKQADDKRVVIKPPFVVQRKFRDGTRAVTRITKPEQMDKKDRALIKIFNDGFREIGI